LETQIHERLNFIYIHASYENKTAMEMPDTDTIHSTAAFTLACRPTISAKIHQK